MSQYIADNPQFIVNGFMRAGISHALDGFDNDEEENGEDSEPEDEAVSEEEYDYMEEDTFTEENID